MVQIIPPPASPLPLRLPDWPLPPYRYVPGCNPHPFRHVDGHQHTDGGAPVADPSAVDRLWLRGMDLYEHRYFWEAHEAWEACWHQTPRSSSLAQLQQGLIQLAASALKRHMGQLRPADRLLAAGRRRLLAVVDAEGPVLGGLLRPCLASAEAFAAGGDWPRLHDLGRDAGRWPAR